MIKVMQRDLMTKICIYAYLMLGILKMKKFKFGDG